MTASWRRGGLEKSIDVSMCMSNSSLAKVQYKIDKERVRHENELKMLNKLAKTELRLSQREVEEVKKELHALRAYKEVAKQTAFKKFDRVELKKMERLEREKHQKSLEEEMDGERTSSSTQEDAPSEGLMERRRSSTSGEVFVTLRDIMDSDDVLQKHKLEIVQQRRKSLTCTDDENGESGDEESSSKTSRVKRWLNSTVKGRPTFKRVQPVSRKKSTSNGNNGTTDASKRSDERPRRRSRLSCVGDLVENTIPEETLTENEYEAKTHDAIETAEEQVDNANYGKSLVTQGKRALQTVKLAKSIFLTTNPANDEEGEQQNTKKTLNAVAEKIRNNAEPHHQTHPMTLFQISKLYEQKKAQTLEETENKLMNSQRRKAQAEYRQFKMKLQQLEHQRALSQRPSSDISHIIANAAENDAERKHQVDLLKVESQQQQQSSMSETNTPENKRSILPDHQRPLNDKSNGSTAEKSSTKVSQPTFPSNTFYKTVKAASEAAFDDDFDVVGQRRPSLTSPSTSGQAAPVTGLARFRNAVTAVSVRQKANQGDRSDRMKNVAAAIVIKSNTTKGRIPASFLSEGAFSWTSPRDVTRWEVSQLEESHRNPDDVKIRPLKMPLGVQAEHEKKWTDVMSNMHYAVYWKVKALREDTGTLNPRQARRQVKEKPPPRKPLFPGECKTSWAMKNYLKQEVGDVLKSWAPENLRRKRNRKLIEKVTMPKFIDRLRTTTCILKSFRNFRKSDEIEDEQEEGALGDEIQDEDENRSRTSIGEV